MKMLLKEFRQEFLKRILDLLWDYWIDFGVSAYSHIPKKQKTVMDPEALLLISGVFGRYDARLFDEILNWLSVNGKFINILKLKNAMKVEHYPAKVFNAISDFVVKEYNLYKWKGLSKKETAVREVPFFYKKSGEPLEIYGNLDPIFRRNGFLRGEITWKGNQRHFSPYNAVNLILRLRALFGVNMRSDLIHYLLVHDSGHPSGMARELYYSQKGVHDTLSEIEESGFVSIIRKGKEKHYILDKKKFFDIFELDPKEVRYINWNKLFISFVEILELIEDEKFKKSSDLVRSSQLRQLMKKVQPQIIESGIKRTLPDPSRYLGESLLPVLFDSILSLLE